MSNLKKEFLNHPNHEYIVFDEDEHSYTFFPDGDKRKTTTAKQFSGVTSWMDKYSQKEEFDADKIAKKCNKNPNSKYYDWGVQAIKDHWIQRRVDGDDIHKAIEECVNIGVYDDDFAPYIDAFWELMDAEGIEPIVSEITVWDKRVGRATNIDIIGIKDDKLIPIDTKTYQDGMKYSAYKDAKFNTPLHGLFDSKFDRVCLQTSIPRKWLTELYDMPVGEAYCVLLNDTQKELLPLLDYSKYVDKLYEWELEEPWD